MAGDADDATLRKSLSSLLDEACKFLHKSTTICRKFQDKTISDTLAKKKQLALDQVSIIAIPITPYK